MQRAPRLLQLLQILRRHHTTVTGAALAEELGISLRTLYRDIASLQEQGADIAGEPGIGYRMRPGFLLPPLMFSEDEIEAIVLGSRWVAMRTDPTLGAAAREALAKIEAVLPPQARDILEHSALLVGPSPEIQASVLDLSMARVCIRERRKVRLAYRDAKGEITDRVVWPVALAFFDPARMLAAWCETRQDFRHFRLDRIESWTPLENRYTGSRTSLLGRWKASLKM